MNDTRLPTPESSGARASLVWTAADSVGDEALDREHQQWFAIVSRLGEAVKLGASDEVLASILEGVIEYTRVHFAHEEARMQAAGFPGFEAHKLVHDQFVEMMERMAELEPSRELMAQVAESSRRWLLDHIRRVDRTYVDRL